MVWLIVGVVLWSVVHLGKSVGRPVRNRLVERLAEEKLKGLAAMLLLGSVVLMVVGWRSTTPSLIYAPPLWGYWAALPVMWLSFFLFGSSGSANLVTRATRHPQLLGFTCWAVAHLLSNGDQRSLVLFGGLGVWAIAAMIGINVRDGAREDRPERQPLSSVAGPALGATVAFGVLWFVHPWITGVGVTPP